MDWCSVHLHDGINVVLPTIDEYDRLYNLCGHDVDYDDDTCEDMHENAITLDDDFELDNDIKLENVRKGDDDKVNAALFEVQFVIGVAIRVAVSCLCQPVY